MYPANRSPELGFRSTNDMFPSGGGHTWRVDDSATTPVERAAAALGAGEWDLARDAYGAMIEAAPGGEAFFGHGIALWWLGETEEALRSWEQAYAAFRRQANHAQAVVSAFYLCLGFRMSLGNDAAANGWLERASGLVDEFQLAPLAGWVQLARAYTANDSGDPSAAAALSRQAVNSARTGADVDLSLCATAELGAALVAMGEFDDGGALLDQAMAGALAGEGDDLDTVVLVSCRTITACSRGADIKRAMQWIRAADDFHQRYGSTHLYTTCRTHHGAVLFAAGDWPHAEAELELALDDRGAADAVLRAEAAGTLAELRLAQGRINEAEELLRGLDDHPRTTVARARLHLADGRPTVAAALVRRRLPELDARDLEWAVLVDLLAETGIDDKSVADAMGVGGDGGVAAAYLRRAAGRRRNSPGGSHARELEVVLSRFGRLQLPYECARTRVLLAQALAAADRDTAISESRAALEAFDELGASRDADAAAALLRRLGAKVARAGPRDLGTLTKREREVLGLLGEGLSNPAIADRLYLSRRTVEHHVANVLSKLGLSGRAGAAAYAARLNRDGITK
jgi:DNA-binding CsgD family transcriptional regulator/predicted negative regulator of RcsB-dependent stress response